ncbi:MAG: AAA family ATPase [Arcobacter sp.]|jgi:predicted ATP-dependent endonuclease of OLD family|uniref:AAA family ATPase n=1 Tax=Arcobacter sp. TaxID=1872629 RepID=UPI002A762C23|nr:AAA family ATPase [Arcobacter sp.]MDY3200635.1 AAA family ATPase [Arcobacter sp.]
MELVYLWVDKYKNIEKQGFNFSPRFRCEYDEEKNELTINENKDYKSIFPDNINVTAIVGENGSGKSSILDVLESYIMRNIVVYYDGLETYYITDIEDIKSIGIKIEKGTINYLEKFIFLSWDILGNSVNNCYTKYLQKKEFHLAFISEYEKIYDFESNFTLSAFQENVLISIFDYSKKTNKPIFNFIPKFISIEIKTISKLNLNKQENEKEIIDIVNSLISKIENKLEKDIENKGFIDGIDFNIKEYFLLFLCKKYESTIDLSKIEKGNIFESLEKYFCDSIFIQIFTQDIFENLENFSINIIGIITEFFMLSNKYVIDEFKKIYKDNKELFTFLIEVGFIKLDYEDEKEKKFLNLSFGERTIFLQSLFIEKEIGEIEETNSGIEDIFLFFDEIDVSLHPYWQKKQIIELINLLSQYNDVNNKKKFHLIITSHSPFLISDLPKQNIIFLENGKQVYPFEDGKQTFGANIHTLLSHGFFMKDGLMGEFAKEKIDLAIKYLNQKILTEDELNYCENIISIIGEPIIKRELQRMINSKRLSEIEVIKKQIAELQQELDKKENKK